MTKTKVLKTRKKHVKRRMKKSHSYATPTNGVNEIGSNGSSKSRVQDIVELEKSFLTPQERRLLKAMTKRYKGEKFSKPLR
jgi:hypothetical protein